MSATKYGLGARVTIDQYSDIGTVAAIGHQIAYVVWDNTGAGWMPQELLTQPGRPNTVNVSEWTRLHEVDAYADDRGIDRATAINDLVNAALSYGLADEL